ncbi:DUF3293 domain-containing protein [Dokdonella sp. MW10]|uniref:DUF3293 domain-containing protein n=1 Tax=Dokdonella sp. MW10 TaxID=2992926 RepID=UPI003F7F3BBC
MATPSPASLLAAYRNTRYDVRLPGGRRLTIRIGDPPPVALILPRGDPTHASAILTACNPRSLPLPAADNRRRMHELVRTLVGHGLLMLPAVGCAPGDAWREASLLVPSIPLDLLDALARRFGQNAVVTLVPEARLRVYREDWRAKYGKGAAIDWA